MRTTTARDVPRVILRHACWVVVALVPLIAPRSAHAQSDLALDIEQLTPATSSDGFLGVQATRTPGPGRFGLGLYTGLEAQPLRMPAFTSSALRGIDLRTTTWVTGEVGVGGRAALSAVLLAYPYQHLLPAAATAANGGTALSSQDQGLNVGDARVAARYRLLGQSSEKPDAPRDGPGVALEAIGMVPTSGGRFFAGERAFRTELDLLADFQLLGAGVGASVGFRHRFEEPQIDRSTGGAMRFGDELTFGAAIKAPLPPVPAIVLLVETRGSSDLQSTQATHLELDLGARVLVGQVALTLGGGFGLTRGLGTPDGRVLLGMAWAPPDRDADGDGVSDDRDQCPMLAEDKDGFQDADGCPDPDNDNDLVPDVDDLCPNLEAVEGKDDNEDGCTDGVKPTKRGP